MPRTVSHVALVLLMLGSLRAQGAGPAKFDWPLFRGDSQASGVAQGSLPEKLELLWKFPTKGGGFEGTAVIASGVVYAGNTDGNLYAVDLASGREKWRFHTEIGFTAAPAYRDGHVYIGDSDGKFYCVDAKNGKQVWQFEANGEIDAGANFYKDNVLFGSQDATLYCLDRSGKLVWKHAIADQIRCSPTVAGNRVFLAGCDGKLHIIDLDKGEPIDAVKIDGPTGSTPAVKGSAVYFGTEGSTFYAIDWKTAQILWTHKSQRNMPIRSSAAVTGELIIFGGRDKQVHALSAKNGDELWNYPTKARVDSSPVVVGNRVFVGSADGRLHAIDRKSGEQLWQYEAGGDFNASPAVGEDRLVIGASDGTLYCFGKKP